MSLSSSVALAMYLTPLTQDTFAQQQQHAKGHARCPGRGFSHTQMFLATCRLEPGAGIPWVENRCQACLHWLGNLSARGEGSRRQPQASTRQKYRNLAGDDRLHAKTGDTTELPESLQQFRLEIPPTIKFRPRPQTPDGLKRSLTERERSVLQLQQVTNSEAL